MRPCWLLVITKDLHVWMPPEVYTERAIALREARRWVSVLSRRRSPADVGAESSLPLPGHAALHLAESQFAEPWRACPLWVGVRWSSEEGATLQSELLALDPDEAEAWVRERSKAELNPDSDPELRFESTWERAGVRSHLAVHRLKRFIGF